jgi:hypothetical protein
MQLLPVLRYHAPDFPDLLQLPQSLLDGVLAQASKATQLSD